jgi:hypothetical protein
MHTPSRSGMVTHLISQPSSVFHLYIPFWMWWKVSSKRKSWLSSVAWIARDALTFKITNGWSYETIYFRSVVRSASPRAPVNQRIFVWSKPLIHCSTKQGQPNKFAEAWRPALPARKKKASLQNYAPSIGKAAKLSGPTVADRGWHLIVSNDTDMFSLDPNNVLLFLTLPNRIRESYDFIFQGGQWREESIPGKYPHRTSD